MASRCGASGSALPSPFCLVLVETIRCILSAFEHSLYSITDSDAKSENAGSDFVVWRFSAAAKLRATAKSPSEAAPSWGGGSDDLRTTTIVYVVNVRNLLGWLRLGWLEIA